MLLNDPQYVEAARVLAEQLIRQQSDSVPARTAVAFRLLTSRQPTPRELEVLLALYDRQLAHYRARPDDATQYIATGEAPATRPWMRATMRRPLRSSRH